MNPCIRGASEYITEQIELEIIEENYDEEYEDIAIEEDESDADGEMGGNSEGNEHSVYEELEKARKESVESFEQMMSKLATIIPCFRCGSKEHSVFDCNVGTSRSCQQAQACTRREALQ